MITLTQYKIDLTHVVALSLHSNLIILYDSLVGKTDYWNVAVSPSRGNGSLNQINEKSRSAQQID